MTDLEEIEKLMTTATGDRRQPGNEELLSAIRSLLGKHVTEKHLDFASEEIQTLVDEHRELYDEVAPLARDTNAKVTLLVDDMYGQPQPTAADPEARDGGWVPVLRAMQQDGIDVKKKWDRPQWAFFATLGAAFISTCGVIIVAIIAG